MTNGEKIKEIFPNVTIESQGEVTTSICIDSSDVPTYFYTDWWNAEYKEPTTKNNLGVDCISRADARSLVVKIGTKDILGMSGKAFQDLYKGIDNLPPVTPQEPTDKLFSKADIDSIIKAVNEGWELRVNEVLGKIRAEIKALSPEPTAYDVVDGNPVKDAIWEILIEVDKIIDKYKAESEGI